MGRRRRAPTGMTSPGTVATPRRGGVLRRLALSGSGLAHGLQTTAGAFLLLAVNFVSGIITARALGPTGRGELVLLLLWPQTFAYLAGLGIPGALVYHVRRTPGNAARLYWSACGLGVAQGVVAAGVGIAVLPSLLREPDITVVHAAQLFMLFAPISLIALYNVGMLQARLEIGLAAAASVTPALVTLLTLLLLLATDTMSPVTAALATIAPVTVVATLVTARFARIYGVVTRGLRAALASMMSFGLRSYPLDVIATLTVVVDQALVAGLLGAAPLGLYVVALRSSRLVGVAANAITPVLFARASGRSTADAAVATGRVLRITTTISIAGALVLIVLGPWLLGVIYGDEFRAAGTALRILAVEIVISSAALILTQTFHAIDRPGYVSILETLSLALMIGLIAALAQPFGLEGVAMAVLIASTVRLAAVALSYRRVLGVELPRFLIGRSDLAWVRDSIRGDADDAPSDPPARDA